MEELRSDDFALYLHVTSDKRRCHLLKGCYGSYGSFFSKCEEGCTMYNCSTARMKECCGRCYQELGDHHCDGKCPVGAGTRKGLGLSSRGLEYFLLKKGLEDGDRIQVGCMNKKHSALNIKHHGIYFNNSGRPEIFHHSPGRNSGRPCKDSLGGFIGQADILSLKLCKRKPQAMTADEVRAKAMQFVASAPEYDALTTNCECFANKCHGIELCVLVGNSEQVAQIAPAVVSGVFYGSGLCWAVGVSNPIGWAGICAATAYYAWNVFQA